ncbi:hypothetical protein Mapa_011392 [Marchantia paleacea]|nr:hypothetical protein Mapa_011392 [Marchantia paleacea]
MQFVKKIFQVEADAEYLTLHRNVLWVDGSTCPKHCGACVYCQKRRPTNVEHFPATFAGRLNLESRPVTTFVARSKRGLVVPCRDGRQGRGRSSKT